MQNIAVNMHNSRSWIFLPTTKVEDLQLHGYCWVLRGTLLSVHEQCPTSASTELENQIHKRGISSRHGQLIATMDIIYLQKVLHKIYDKFCLCHVFFLASTL